MLVVADTGPPHYLVLIGDIDLLPQLFGRVLLPDVVRDELQHVHTPASVRRWIAAPPEWVEIVTPPPLDAPQGTRLDAGERAAIAIALARQADLVLMDDRRGVAAATALGLQVIGTIGLLDRAARRGLIDLEDAFARLQATSFRRGSDLLATLLARHKEERET